jgi:hypothetical protein
MNRPAVMVVLVAVAGPAARAEALALARLAERPVAVLVVDPPGPVARSLVEQAVTAARLAEARAELAALVERELVARPVLAAKERPAVKVPEAKRSVAMRGSWGSTTPPGRSIRRSSMRFRRT